MTKKQQVVLFILSYAGWFGCVLLGKWNLAIFSYAVPFVFFIFLRLYMEGRPTLYGCSIALLGLGFDTLAWNFDWITFGSNTNDFLPHWLISLWLLFCLSLPLYHQWLQRRYLLAGTLGLILGPLSYKSGEAFKVLFFNNNHALIYYGVFWAAFFPVSLYCYQLIIDKFESSANVAA